MTSLKIVKGRELAEGAAVEVHLPALLNRFSIGRDPANHWAIPDPTLAVSGRHCEIVATPAGTSLRDLSTNGTFVNGESSRLAGEHLLRDGDRFEIGPYVILVSDPRAQTAAAPQRDARATPSLPAAPARPAPPPRSAGVEVTTPLRGGDPAAMFAGGGRSTRAGLTEILRSLPPTEESEQAVTKIRAAPRPAAPLAASSSSAPAARAAPGHAVAAPASGLQAEALRPLAIALGLAPDALAGRDPAETVAQVGALARAAVTVLRQLLDQQAAMQRRQGIAAPARLPGGEVDPLRMAATADAALRALLAPGADVDAALRRAGAELSARLAGTGNERGPR